MSMAVKAAKYGMQGDPGIFGDIWKGIKSVGRFAGGVAKASGLPIVSGIGGAVTGILASKRDRIPGASTRPPLITSFANPQQYPGPGVGRAAPVRVNWKAALPGGQPFLDVPQTNGVPSASMGGYHLNKTGYFVKERDANGNFTGGWERVEPGSRWVKNRRRNSLNPRALSRAIGRVKGAKSASKMLSSISIRKKC